MPPVDDQSRKGVGQSEFASPSAHAKRKNRLSLAGASLRCRTTKKLSCDRPVT
jgi:hypothetical protein